MRHPGPADLRGGGSTHYGSCSMTDIARPVVKQEQQPASDDVAEVAPGVLRMQLPIRFTGLGHVNMYGLVDDRGLAIVDPGMPGRQAYQAVVAALARAGYRPRDVHTVVITHSHPDHFGGALRLAEDADAGIVAHADFRVPWAAAAEPDVASLEDGDVVGTTEMAFRDHRGLRVPWRAPDDALPPPKLPSSVPKPLLKVAWRLGHRFLRAPTPTQPLQSGDVVRLAGREWFAVHTPGHTADHLCLHDPEHRLLLAGDHVLPTITPHVSGIGCGADPLRQYLDALGLVARLDVDLALPAHGHPFGELADRTRQISQHHDERLARLRAIAAAEGPATVETFTRALFPPAQWGLMAESEVFAHLEHLRRGGSASADRRDGVLVYHVDTDLERND